MYFINKAKNYLVAFIVGTSFLFAANGEAAILSNATAKAAPILAVATATIKNAKTQEKKSSLKSMTLSHHNDRTINAFIEQEECAVVIFYADWCGPCRRTKPVLEKLARELGQEISFAKVNIEESPEAAAKFHPDSLPTIVLFKNGKEVARRTGAANQATLKQWIRK